MPDAAPAPLRAHMLGPTRITVGDRELTDDAWPRRTARTLLLLLLAEPGHRLPRERVLDALWPDASPESALSALYTALATLRRTLQPALHAGRDSAYVEARGGMIGLRTIAGTQVDLDAFRAATARSRTELGADRLAAIREAVGLYAGEFLADEPYAEWTIPTRERARHDWRRAVLDLAELEIEAGRPLAALPALDALLESDPTDEAVHRAVMRAHAAVGHLDEALRAFERCLRVVRDELDAEPSDETTRLAAEIAKSPPVPPGATRPPLAPAPLPVAPTPMVGRSHDVAALRLLLAEPAVRLITVVGPGGIGKTRLVLEVARRADDRSTAETAFVSLASIRDPALVIPTIARTLGLEDAARRPAEELLRDALYQRELLLVLDNFEQVVSAAAAVGSLLEANRGLRLVVTSREPLHLRGERIHTLSPLEVPTTEVGPGKATKDAIGGHESVILFVARVRDVLPEFVLTDDNAPVVGAICARLDGLPLAIELAAARARHLDLPALLERLEPRLPLLSGGPRDLPERLRTMGDAIAWSHDLLDGSERQLFRCLSVFTGGCSLDTAEAVCGRDDSERDEVSLLDTIGSLADKSLVHLNVVDGTRVTMLETIREFGLGQLSTAGEHHAVRMRHAGHFLELAERGASEMNGPRQAEWLARLELDHDNVRAAFETYAANGSAAEALRLVRALSPFWRIHGHLTEGRQRVDRAVALPGARGLARARALTSAAELAELQGDYARAVALHREGEKIFHRSGDRQGEAESALGLAAIAVGRSEFGAAADLAERARALFAETGDRRRTASALNYLANVAFHQGAFEQAGQRWTECLALLRELGDRRAVSIVLGNLGVLDLEFGKPDDAIANYRLALDVARDLGDPYGTTHPLINLGRVLVLVGRLPEAQRLLQEALDNCRRLNDPVREAITLQVLALAALAESRPDEAADMAAASLRLSHRGSDRLIVAASLEALGTVALARGAHDTATRFLAAAESVRKHAGAVRESADQRGFERDVLAARAALGDAAFDAAWLGGGTLSFDAAAAEGISYAATRTDVARSSDA